jgi:hypothetical protein
MNPLIESLSIFLLGLIAGQGLLVHGLWLPKIVSRRSIALQSGKLLTEWFVF